MKKKVPAILLLVMVLAAAAIVIALNRPYKPTSFVVDGDGFSASVEDGATLILDLDNDRNRKEWSIIQTSERLQCFVKDYVTVTDNVTEFHIIATDAGKDMMLFQCVSDDGTTESYELTLSISRHKKRNLQIDTVSFVRTEDSIRSEKEHGSAENTTPDERNWDRIPTVMIDGVLYESTGYISSAIGCGTMDGRITSTVEGNETPAKNDQSNFGVGYEYQRSSEGQTAVVMDGMKVIFRDPKHSFAFDIPEEVLNFNAEVLEVRNGSLLVSFISTPDLFMPPFTGQCVVRVNPHILKEEVKVGDTVRVWFDGLVQEIYPPILPNVYRVVKEEREPAEPENSKAEGGIKREDGERFEGVIMIEGMEEAVSYEHIRNSSIGVEMDYDYELFERHSEADRDCFVSCYDDSENPENYLEVTCSAVDAETAAASISEALSKDYDIIREEFMLERAGSCIRIDASADKGGMTMPEHLQMVYIIPADDGCRIATAHYAIEGAEGFGVRFRNMMHTLEVIETE